MLEVEMEFGVELELGNSIFSLVTPLVKQPPLALGLVSF